MRDQHPDFIGQVERSFAIYLYLLTIIGRNPSLLARITPPLLSVASQQITGRGRGANVWVSPAGCLMLSLVLKTNSVELPLHRLVFVQYLFALAITEACRDEMVLGRDGDKVRLKWPNDIYAIESGEKRKIGGVLVNLVFEGSHAQIVLGGYIYLIDALFLKSFCLLPRLWFERLDQKTSHVTLSSCF